MRGARVLAAARVRALAGALLAITLAGCGFLRDRQAHDVVAKAVAPLVIAGFSDEHVYKGTLVCGYVDLKNGSTRPEHRQFIFASNTNAAWVEGVTIPPGYRRTYGASDVAIWRGCMGKGRGES